MKHKIGTITFLKKRQFKSHIAPAILLVDLAIKVQIIFVRLYIYSINNNKGIKK